MRGRFWPDERRRKLLMLIERGTTLPQLANDLGMRRHTVESYCYRHGLLPRLIKCHGGPKRSKANVWVDSLEREDLLW